MRDLDRLDVGGVVAARAADVGVLADLGVGEELLGLRAAHGAGRRLDDDVVEAEPVEDLDVGLAVGLVRRVEPLVGGVEGVAVLHHELAAAEQAGAGTRLVAVLGLDLVQPHRQVLVRRVQVLHDEGEHLLVRGAEEVVGTLAVLEPEDTVAVLRPAAGGLVGLARAAAPGTAAPGRRSRPSPRARSSRCCAAPAGPAAARCRRRGRLGGCSPRARAAGGSAPRRPPGPHGGSGRTGSTCAGSCGKGYLVGASRLPRGPDHRELQRQPGVRRRLRHRAAALRRSRRPS